MFLGKKDDFFVKVILLGLLCVLAAKKSYSDSWQNPVKKTFYNADSTYCLIVSPGRFLSQKELKRLSKKIIVTDMKEGWNPCIAILYELNYGDSILVWKRNLSNLITPVDVIINESATFIVTFDDWFSAGYGTTTMVVYDSSGNMVKQYALADISPIFLYQYSRSFSSIHWRKNAYFAPDNVHLIIEFIDKNNNIYVRRYNCITQRFEK